MTIIIFAICSISQHLNLHILSPEQNNDFGFPESTIPSWIFLKNIYRVATVLWVVWVVSLTHHKHYSQLI